MMITLEHQQDLLNLNIDLKMIYHHLDSAQNTIFEAQNTIRSFSMLLI